MTFAPALTIRFSQSREAEKTYILSVIFNEFLGIPIKLETSAREEYCICDGNGNSLVLPDVFFQSAGENWLKPAHLPRGPLRLLEVHSEGLAPGIKSIPVLYGLLGYKTGYASSIDLIGSIFFMLTRYEEIIVSKRDEHLRSQRTESVLTEFPYHRPIVEEYLAVLRQLLFERWPGISFKRSTYTVQASHDVDFPYQAYKASILSLVRQSSGDLKRGAIRDSFWRWGCNIPMQSSRDPGHNFPYLLEMLSTFQLTTSFNFFGRKTNHPLDANYSLGDRVIDELLLQIKSQGHDIGFHGSYLSYNRVEVLKQEFVMLRKHCEHLGVAPRLWGGRQHFLRWENPVTWQAWEDVGLSYDSTVGYAETVGFRCGTSRDFPVFNLITRTALKLRERPLILMEVTLLAKHYMATSRLDVHEIVTRLRDTCRAYETPITILWHNSNLVRTTDRQLYRDILEILCT